MRILLLLLCATALGAGLARPTEPAVVRGSVDEVFEEHRGRCDAFAGAELQACLSAPLLEAVPGDRPR